LGDIEQASECGTDDFVSKPVNKFELLTRVKSLLRVRHLKSELERALTYLNEIEHDEDVLLRVHAGLRELSLTPPSEGTPDDMTTLDLNHSQSYRFRGACLFRVIPWIGLTLHLRYA